MYLARKTCVGTYSSSGRTSSLWVWSSHNYKLTKWQSQWLIQPAFLWLLVNDITVRKEKPMNQAKHLLLLLFDSQRIASDASVSQTKCSTDWGMTPCSVYSFNDVLETLFSSLSPISFQMYIYKNLCIRIIIYSLQVVYKVLLFSN